MDGGVQAFVRRRPLLSFYGLAITFPILLFTYLIIVELTVHNPAWPGGRQVAHYYATRDALVAAHPILAHHADSVIVSLMSYWAVPSAAPFLFFPFAPTVAALIVVWIGWRGAGLRALLGAYRPVRGSISVQAGVRLYIVLAAFIAAALALALLALNLDGDVTARDGFAKVLGLFDARYVVVTFATALFLNQGGLLEELGWRGYALPLLMRRFGSPLVAALVLGVLWALWHFPREIPLLLQGNQDFAGLLAGQAMFIASCCASTVVLTSFVNLSGGSVLPAIILHGCSNLLFSAYQTGAPVLRGDFMNPSILVWGGAAALCVLALGADLGLRARQAAHGGDGSTDPSRIWAGGDGR